MSAVRILLVDDEPALLLTLAANLELDGFEVTAATSGEDALAAFSAQAFDLVLSDVKMPGMSGVELFRKIREQERNFPFVLMTGFALEELVGQAISEGVFTILAKPFDVQEVVAALTTAARSPVVLIVEGDAASADAIATALERAGVRSSHASGPDDALSAVTSGKVDVCVVDMNLPGGEALGLMQRIRDHDATIIQIAVANAGAPMLVRQAAGEGSFACMEKPIAPRELIEVIARARGQRGSTSGRVMWVP